jgi:hypothetical protein
MSPIDGFWPLGIWSIGISSYTENQYNPRSGSRSKETKPTPWVSIRRYFSHSPAPYPGRRGGGARKAKPRAPAGWSRRCTPASPARPQLHPSVAYYDSCLCDSCLYDSRLVFLQTCRSSASWSRRWCSVDPASPLATPSLCYRPPAPIGVTSSWLECSFCAVCVWQMMGLCTTE